MTTPWVADLQVLYRRLPASACVPDARQLAGAAAASNALDLPGHGYADGDLVSLSARTGAELDSAIDPLVEYVVARINSRYFRLVGVTLAGDGVGLPFVFENVEPKLRAIMGDVCSYIVASAIAYKVPWTIAPAWANSLAGDLAAPRVASILRIEAARYDMADIAAGAKRGQELIDRLQAGAVLPDGTGPVAADATPNDTMRAQGRPSAGWLGGSSCCGGGFSRGVM